MTPVSAPSERRPISRWWVLVLLVLAAQVALIFWLGLYEPRRPAPPRLSPTLTLANSQDKAMLTLANPTLFALPHREGFSGPAWLSVPSQEIRPFAWTEPPRFLELPVNQLAVSFPPSAVGKAPDWSPGPADFEPELLLAPPDEKRLFPERSTVRSAGWLDGRAMTTPLNLPSWPHTEVLSNSVVQVLVDASGAPISAILLGQGCGLKAADDYAVRQARAVHFAPLPLSPGMTSPLAGLVCGELVFEWHTIPATNAPAQTP